MTCSTGVLKGFEAQRLRSYCTSECMEPGRDLDSYGEAIFSGDLTSVRADFAVRVARFTMQSSLDEERARRAAA